MANTKYLFHMREVVGLVGTEVFYRQDPSVVVPGLPHVGKAAGGERAFHFTGCHQGQPLRYAERSWQHPVDATSLSQRSKGTVVHF